MIYNLNIIWTIVLSSCVSLEETFDRRHIFHNKTRQVCVSRYIIESTRREDEREEREEEQSRQGTISITTSLHHRLKNNDVEPIPGGVAKIRSQNLTRALS